MVKVCPRPPSANARLSLGQTRDLREIIADSVLCFLEPAPGLAAQIVRVTCSAFLASILPRCCGAFLPQPVRTRRERRVQEHAVLRYVCLRLLANTSSPSPHPPPGRVRTSDGSRIGPRSAVREFSIIRFRSAVAMGKSGKLAAASSGAGNSEAPFDLPATCTTEYRSCNLG